MNTENGNWASPDDADVRYKQRFSSFQKAFSRLTEAVNYLRCCAPEGDDAPKDVLRELYQEGLIQRFEYTHELAWKVMKNYAEYQGYRDIKGSRDATRMAFKMGLISAEFGEVWMEMIRSRNETSHTYDDETADEIYERIMTDYYSAFKDFDAIMSKI